MRQTSKRRHDRPIQPLQDAVNTTRTAAGYTRKLKEKRAEQEAAFLAAAEAGYSVREIASATDMNASKVWRMIVTAEQNGGSK